LIAGLHSPASETEAQWRQRQIQRNQAAIALLDRWATASDDEVAEQQETWSYLRQALNEDRAPDQPLYP
jgi:hypothetical protein